MAHLAQLLDGRTLAKTIRGKIKERVTMRTDKPGLAIFLVGNDPASHLYVSLKEKACQEAGIRFEKFLYPENVPQKKLIEKIQELNGHDDINGILVQLPLPAQDADAVIAAINPMKDVDGFHPENIRRLEKIEPGLVSAVALGVMKLIESSGQNIQNKTAVLVCSELFGHPLVCLLKERGVSSTIVSSTDPDLALKTKTADVLIVAVGKPGLITGNMIKPGAIIIDVGTTRIDDKVVGDVDAESTKQIAGFFTPVPGGVGPMTVAMLLVNVLKAYELQRGQKIKI